MKIRLVNGSPAAGGISLECARWVDENNFDVGHNSDYSSITWNKGNELLNASFLLVDNEYHVSVTAFGTKLESKVAYNKDEVIKGLITFLRRVK